MKFKAKPGWIGKVKIVKTNVLTGKKTEQNIFNRIMDDAFDELIKSLYSISNSNMYFKHIAIGDDNSANSDDMDSLVNEIYRVPVISRLRVGTGECESRGIILDTEPPDEDGGSPDTSGYATIREIGFFAGSNSLNWNSGAGKDSGLLVARVLVTENKTPTEQINITRTDQFVRG